MDTNALPATAQEALIEFQEWANERFDRYHPAAGVDSPRYHYTNAAGLKGMLESEEIWLTNILHLNDPGEVGYGIALAIDELRSRIAEEDEGFQSLLGAACEYVSRSLAHAAFFVASFSADGDELNQWRAYGDNGRGYALGIDANLFHHRLMEETAGLFVAPVIYDESEARRRHREVADKFIAILRAGVESEWAQQLDVMRKFVQQAHHTLSIACRLNSIAMKHPAYKYEQETRFILITSRKDLVTRVRTRVRGYEFVTFVSMPMKFKSPGAITRIVTGPAAPELAHYGVECLLESQGVSAQTLVTASTILYRP